MVFFICGLVGSGKSTLSRKVSEILGLPHYEIDKTKLDIYRLDPDYEYNYNNNLTFSDETRAKAFNKVVADIAELAKTHRHIIIDETLHKKEQRHILFDGATKHFGGYKTIQIVTSEDKIKDRLSKDKREGHLVKDGFAMYSSLKNTFGHLEPDYTFKNNTDLETSVSRLAELVRNEIDK